MRTRQPRNNPSRHAAQEAMERKRLCSQAANEVRARYQRYALLGLMSRNAKEWMEQLIRDLEDGAV